MSIKYKTKKSGIIDRPQKIRNTLIGPRADISKYGYYKVIPPADAAPQGQEYVDSGLGTYDEEKMEYYPDWILADIPKAIKTWTVLEFKRIFTSEERIAIRQAAKTDPVVEDFLDILETTAISGSLVSSNDQDLIQGIEYMREKGLISQQTADKF